MTFEARDPDFEHRVRASFERQAAMRLFGVTMERVTPGTVELSLSYRADLTQQHGFLHAGVAAAVVDSACGYAALSLMEPGVAVLSVEFKVQLLAPARGAWFRARGEVVRAGRTLSVVSGELHAFAKARDDADAEEGEVVTLLTGTMMTVRGRPELVD
ncbi:MAG TPA: PaaI family thioesterase [Gemmatimonadaceae bacterium]|nr:PaaI family thioesterase [Gemmatimonadaceae bacterium]